ncbi:MAG TPA: outer membrane protein assembly factor BamA [Candidatus Omnitrophica bacterium]|nr:MAG: outer membrane protein assembly factor BamA [Omnitrophica WOR_2 bacterium GWA2_63_20]OGX35585.1 MAG: outer membrane protein assembly factor BamA [Omnitrophica WOR_2 bacterium RIFCSPHIGHO2_02_FULL_63_39]OGX47074.1 MAG: outer membrane protein assembly factor BamA [Omnitrophica WOR_2 bacterium RIFCSPLOWO2_12_FULL_63_16]HBH97430.1 outer membrane protein assembly factor BamA [Candidatus Omnitrophota bacterium]HBQ37699.1 outer membrane protein assembly factor BamA [Candidatus Omnitrophota bac
MGLGLGLWAMGMGCVPAQAEEVPSPRVVSVEVEGTRTIATETCVARLQTRPGSPYLEHIVTEDIRRLFALGYFTDVRVETQSVAEGLRVIFRVTEKPALGEVAAEGFRRLGKDKILQLLGLKAGALYDARLLKEGLDRVKAEYRRRGFARVEAASSTQVDASANTVTVYVVIDEGPRMLIKDTLVEGNLAFSDARIRKVMKTKRRQWFIRGVYAEQVLEEDLERIRAFYRRAGYQDVQASSEVAAAPEGEGLYLIVTIAEGLQHRIGTISLAGTVVFPEREIRQVLTIKPGSVYQQEALQETLRAIKQYYGDRGHINADVAPDIQLDPDTKRVDVTFRITENELVYVHRVEVQGNLRTRDVVIRRELRIHPGQPFDGKLIRRSIERLYNLGYFEEVNVETAPTDAANREDLLVKVKEAKTGSFSFGGGFSSVDRLVGLVEIEQRNFDWRNWPTFTGAGQDLRFRVEAGSVRRNFDLSFTEPWIFARPISFGFDAFSRTRLRSQDLGLAFEEQSVGGALRLGKDLTDALRVTWNYQLFRTDISDIVEEASADLKAEVGRSDVSLSGLGISWDSRDNRFDPTAGWLVFGSADLAGGVLAGDRDFYRLQGGASAYWPHGRRFVLESRLHTGLVQAYSGSSTVPIFERFFGGGANTVRGFRERRIGPRDPRSNDPIGGEATFMGGVEEVATLMSDERGKPILKGTAFFDVGDVWQKVDEYGESLKAGAGMGVRVTTPIGPVRLDVGFPISRLEDEKRKPRLHFNISRSF